MNYRKPCPLPVSLFTGRTDIRQDMRRFFDRDRGFRHVFVLYGLGGSDKSQLAFQFVQDSQADDRFSEIFYVNATNEQTIETDLKAIAPAKAGDAVAASLESLVR
ncbi:hypothetical protein B0H14DRAFT_456347 [Mycena olivaceomarginata]|nr:hypothetical protein B0H14DRAFT_456347 [Mycena olivaceomarginata]